MDFQILTYNTPIEREDRSNYGIIGIFDLVEEQLAQIPMTISRTHHTDVDVALVLAIIVLYYLNVSILVLWILLLIMMRDLHIL